jgi:molybdate transport system ATP-binding protein
MSRIAADFRHAWSGFSLDVKLDLPVAGLTALFGPSGSGKTTILRCIAGLERPDFGRLSFDGDVWQDERRWLPPHRRPVGYVFQEASLFPHLSVLGNLRYALRRASGEPRMGLENVVAFLGLAHLLNRRPGQLSGGERQRVAIGRALLSAPRLLLMDEPLAALDMARKREILPYIERLNTEYGMPVIYVSHAVDEVARLAGEVVVIRDGRVAATGSPESVLPATGTGFDRFARVSLLKTKVGECDLAYRLTVFHHPAGNLTLAGEFGSPGREVNVVVRATDVTLARARPQEISARTMLEGCIATIERSEEPVAIVNVALEGGDHLAAALTRKAVDELHLEQGQPVWCLLKSVSVDERWIAAS